jgi:hypothetical protein
MVFISLSYVISLVLSLLYSVPLPSYFSANACVLIALVVGLIPLIETFLFQLVPINFLQRRKAGFWTQVCVSTALFAIAHFQMNGIVSGVSAGLVGGFGLAIVYARFVRRKISVAFWMTMLSHSIRNGIVVASVLVSIHSTPSLSYDFICHPSIGSAWYVYNENQEVVYAVLDARQVSRMELSSPPNTTFREQITIPYKDHPVTAMVRDSTLWLHDYPYPLKKHRVFQIVHEPDAIRITPVLDKNLSLPQWHRDTVAIALESMLWDMHNAKRNN